VDEQKVLGDVVRTALTQVLDRIKARETKKRDVQSLSSSGAQNGAHDSLETRELVPVAQKP
jgi:Arc/MetJ-type ribon-helix-helix transcriptional regulator